MPNFPLATPTNHHFTPLVIYRDTIMQVYGEYRFLTSESTASEIAGFLRARKGILHLGIPLTGTVSCPQIDEFDAPFGTTFANLTDVLGELNIP